MTLHKDLTGDAAIHPAAYVQTDDPGAVGAKKLWIDITDPDVPLYKVRNDADDGWDDITPAGTTELAGLTDVDLTGLSDGDVLIWDTGTSKWVALDPTLLPPVAVALDDLSDVNAPAPSDGDVLKWDDGAGEWVAAADETGGGGGGAVFPDDAPGSPSAFDDEFTAGSLDAKWTEVGSPHASFTKFANKFDSWWGMEGTGNATNDYIIRQTLSGFTAGVAFQATIKCSFGWKQGSGPLYMGINVGDASTFETSNYTEFRMTTSSDELKIDEWHGSGLFGVNPGPKYGGNTLFLHIQRDASNVMRYYVSFDGISFSQVGSQTTAYTLAYLFLRAYGSTSSGNPCRLLIDWVRVNDARFTQPV